MIQTLGSLRASGDGFVAGEVSQSRRGFVRWRRQCAGANGGERTVDEIIPVLANDSDVELRRAAINALGRLKDKKAVPILNAIFQKDDTKFEVTGALAQMPDVRALDAYLFGLGSPNVVVRENCRKAMSAIAADALREIESRLATNGLASSVIGELQKVFREVPGAQASRLFQQTVKERDPNEYLEFAMKNKGAPVRGRKFFFDCRALPVPAATRWKGRG